MISVLFGFVSTLALSLFVELEQAKKGFADTVQDLKVQTSVVVPGRKPSTSQQTDDTPTRKKS